MANRRGFVGRLALTAIAVIVLLPATMFANDRLVVHEWGTFTTLQNENGHELSGINIDDEPAPDFVHNLSPYLLNSAVLTNQSWQYRQKGAPREHPLVTMRLETPVIYFYPPQNQNGRLTLDVNVRFQGGWLTEFYPYAEASAPGLDSDRFEFEKLNRSTVGSLTWRDLQVGTDGKGPQTSEPVWLAPRAVASTNVSTPDGEHEKFLFYRGVANQRSPLRVKTDREKHELRILGNFDEVLKEDQKVPLPAVWLLSVRKDGSIAYRTVKAKDVSGRNRRILARVSSKFEESDYSKEKLDQVKSQMHAALMADGLYADEATALLSTWQRAYFISPGLRLFYLVPRQWTDHYLQLTLSRDADVRRVMMGRIELISEEQRSLLAKLAKMPVSDGSWVDRIPEGPAKDQLLSGHSNFGDLGVPIPPDYQAYLELGRFRNVLVVAAERAHPTETLTKFINTYGLHPYRAAPQVSVSADTP